MRAAIALCAALAGCAHAPAKPAALPPRIVNLSHSFDEHTIYWPTSPIAFVRETLSYGRTPAGFFYSAGKFAAAEHGGTHLDAPIHFAERGVTADAIPLERLAGPAVVIDIAGKAGRDADALLAPADIDSFERHHGRIEAGTIVLVRTGWSARWPDRKRYLGDDTPGDASHLHFPGVSAEAASALVARRVAAVGIDTASIDHGPSKDFRAHQALAGADVPIFENVTDLSKLPPRGALVVALPMKIKGGSGGPLRIVAFLP